VSLRQGYYRKGCALEALERFEEALDIFREAAKYNPEVRRALEVVARV
jgi:tetratricopeptide (TPR) repeat protein